MKVSFLSTVMPTPAQLASEVALLLPPAGGNVTSGMLSIDRGQYTEYFFCVSGRGENLGAGTFLAGSGGIVVRRGTNVAGGGVGEQ